MQIYVAGHRGMVGWRASIGPEERIADTYRWFLAKSDDFRD